MLGSGVATYTGLQHGTPGASSTPHRRAERLGKKLRKAPKLDRKHHRGRARSAAILPVPPQERPPVRFDAVADRGRPLAQFILYTRNYQYFCNKAFGGYMHHTPAVALGRDQADDIGLRRTWRHACLEENINPSRSTLPLRVARAKPSSASVRSPRFSRPGRRSGRPDSRGAAEVYPGWAAGGGAAARGRARRAGCGGGGCGGGG